MTILELINKLFAAAGPNVQTLDAFFLALEAKYPDLKTVIAVPLAALEAPLDLAALAGAIPPEAWQVIQGHIDSREHAGDSS